ncbi:ribonuclease T(2) [Mycobacterium sp. SA01]|uniref:ribonuclease T2 family protein n=1 Tax=Mycobacterium sp. SA01 TaxID=3238820 RepID=UPI00351BAABA
MRRGDVAVLSISAALGAVVVAAVVVSVLVVDRPREPSRDAETNSNSSLLVVTWGPALCKVDPPNPGCRSGHVGSLGPAFILHGLWPQPPTQQFCGVPKGGRNPSLAELKLPQDVQTDLQSMMSDAGVMAPHEWSAHGTCSGLPPADYFTIATKLTEQVTAVLNPIFRNAEGGNVSLSTVRGRFDAAFGAHTGDRVGMNCREAAGSGMIVYELHLSLPPVADLRSSSNASLGELLDKGPTILAGCRHGLVS